MDAIGRQAARQAAVIAAGIVAVAALAWHAASRPVDRAQLAILAQEVRAHDAEVRWLEAEARSRRAWPGRLVRAHAEQLSLRVDRTLREVEDARAAPGDGEAAQALGRLAEAARSLRRRLEAVQDPPRAGAPS